MSSSANRFCYFATGITAMLDLAKMHEEQTNEGKVANKFYRLGQEFPGHLCVASPLQYISSFGIFNSPSLFTIVSPRVRTGPFLGDHLITSLYRPSFTASRIQSAPSQPRSPIGSRVG